MIFPRTKLTATSCVVFLSPLLLVGCHKIHSTTNSQISQMQPRIEENGELIKLNRLAEQGNAEAQYRLGLMYDMGEDVNQDYSKAFEWYEKSANQGLASSQSKLGSMYRYGKGVEVNHAKATEWYFKAYEQGDEIAGYQLGTIYISNKDKLSH